MRRTTLLWLAFFPLASCTNSLSSGAKDPVLVESPSASTAFAPAGTVVPPPAEELGPKAPPSVDDPTLSLGSEDLSPNAPQKSPYGAGLEEQSGPAPTEPTLGDPTGEVIAPEKTPLEQATALFEAAAYEDALKILREVPEDSPEAKQAGLLKLKVANKAVAELRTKAAKALQSALSLLDLSAKQNYLKSSKTYLVKALTDFPESNQLELVKKNLGMVEKELEMVASQGVTQTLLRSARPRYLS